MFKHHKIKSYERAEVKFYALWEEVRDHPHAQTALHPQECKSSVSKLWSATFYYAARGHVCKLCGTIKITQYSRRLGIQLLHSFTLAARELAYSDGCGPLP
jgi:hypothetical protein